MNQLLSSIKFPVFDQPGLKQKTFYELAFEILDTNALWKQTDYGVMFIEDVELFQNEVSSKISLSHTSDDTTKHVLSCERVPQHRFVHEDLIHTDSMDDWEELTEL